jgi:hypothetical protein
LRLVSNLLRGAERLAVPRRFNEASAQVIAVDAPADVNPDNAAESANPQGGHDSTNFGSYPPSNPAKDYHTNKYTEPVHILSDSNY